MDILTRFIGNNQPLPKPTSLTPRYPWACELLKLDRQERAAKAPHVRQDGGVRGDSINYIYRGEGRFASDKKAETRHGLPTRCRRGQLKRHFSAPERARNADIVLTKYEGVFRALAAK